MSGLGVSTITAPELKTVQGDAVIKFKIGYERYLRQIQDINRSKSASQKIKPADVKACIGPELLLSLITLNTFPDCTTPDDVNTTHVEDWLKTRERCSTDDMPAHVKDALSRVKFKPDRSGPAGATLQFFTDTMTELRRNRVGHAI